MAIRRRTLLFTLALGFSAAVAPAGSAFASPAQDPTVTFGTGTETTTTAVAVEASTTTTEASGNNQTLVESEEQPEKAIFTESRKVAAVIGGLVIVALALLLLTVRYIRVTKPVPAGDISDLPFLPEVGIGEELDSGSVFVVDIGEADPTPAEQPVPEEPATEPASPEPVAGADHDGADEDWKPKTDEHQRVEVPTGSVLARPGAAARRKALGLDGD